MKDSIAWSILRWGFAAFYLMVGTQGCLAIFGLVAKPEFDLSPQNQAFQQALEQTGFVFPAILIIYVVAGLALLRVRTAPLGIVLLAPIMVNIFFTNVLLDSGYVWGASHLVILLALTWHFRDAYTKLWNYKFSS